MIEWLFSWEVTSWAVALLIAGAFGFLALDDFKLARVCFLFAAADALGGIAMWGAKLDLPIWGKVILVFVLVGTVGVLTMFFLQYVNKKEAKKRSESKPETEPNIEANILAWAKHGEFMAVPMPDPTTYFSFLVTTPDLKIMQVCKPREFMGERYVRYVLLIARVKPTPPQVEVLKDFSPYEQKRLVGDLKAGLLEGYKNSLSVPGPPYEGLEIQKKLSLTQPLTEDVFIAALNEVGAEMALSAQIVIKAVDDHVARKQNK
jgi:hypothetical protein